MMDNQENKNKIPISAVSGAPAPGNNEDAEIDNLPMYRKKRVIIPLFILLIAVVFGAYFVYINFEDYVSTDDAYIDADRVSISTKILGRIEYLGTQEGDSVKSGQILVKLDDSDLLAQKTSALASIQMAEESSKLSKVMVDKSEEDFKRAQVQIKDGVITQEQYDHNQKAYDAAIASYNIDLSKITSAKSQLGVIESQLQNTTIISPMDGFVAKRWVLTGDVVQPGQPIFSIYDVKNLWVTANMEETKVGKLHLNSTVEMSVDSYPGIKFSGKIFDIGMYTASEFSLIPPNNASGNFTKVTQRIPVKISINNNSYNNGQKLVFSPGMSVDVSVKVR
jgi:membrane fusion protein (multidrug efflux system)